MVNFGNYVVVPLAAGVLVAASTVHGVPQAPSSSERPLPSRAAEVVSIVVTVQDNKGSPVADLGPDAFVLREDGRPQIIQAFARTGDPGDDPRLAVDLALLLDVSESVADRIKRTRLAAATFLEAVPRVGELFVFLFHEEIRGFRYRDVGREKALELIAAMPTGGNTALYDAIREALSSLRRSAGRQVLVLLSDGEDSTSRLSYDELVRVVKASRAIIYPVALPGTSLRGSNRDMAARRVLQAIADMTGGEVLNCGDVESLPRVYDRILTTLSSQYVLGFVPDNPRRGGTSPRLKVEVKRPGCRARYRERYYVPSEVQ